MTSALKSMLGLSIVVASVAGLAPISLLSAGNYTILAQTGISTVPQSTIIGDIAVSPATGAAVTGFSLISVNPGTFAASDQVIGKVYAADFVSPTPSLLTQAVLDMQAAFIDGNSRILPDSLNLGAGLLTSQTLIPGLYKWTTGVSITTAITFAGSPTDVWILQISKDLLFNSAAQTFLSGGTLSKNIFWVVSGSVTLGSTSLLQGVILGATNAALITGASVNGRILAQTAVTLQQSTVNPA